MEESSFWTIALSVLGVAVTALVPLLVHRATHPRRQVSYSLSFAPFGVPMERGQLSVATLQMWASGRADIPSSRFDGGRPFVMQFDGPILDQIRPYRPELTGWGFERHGADQLVFRPALIGRGVVHRAEVVVLGRPRVVLRHALIDTRVVQEVVPAGLGNMGQRGTEPRKRIGALTISALITAMGALLFVIAVPLAGVLPEDWVLLWALIGALSMGLLLGGLASLTIVALVRLVRVAARRRAAR